MERVRKGVGDQAIGRSGRAGQPGPAHSLLALQQTAGNRAVATLVVGSTLARQPLKTKPKPKRRGGLAVTVVPQHPMSGEELALLVLEQLYGDDPAAAADRLNDWRARGVHGRGPRFEEGITADQVGQPITVGVDPPRAGTDAAETEDAKLRAQDLAEMDKGGRQSINDETNRRFWAKLGDESHGKLGLGADDRAGRELWMQTRDEVLKERDQVLQLPDVLQDEIMPYHELSPEAYKTAIRLGQETKDFTAADWARYERNAVGSTDDLEVFEAHVQQFAAKRAGEQALLNRLKGSEGFYKAWHDPWSGKGLKRERLTVPPGFKDFDDYDEACAAYLQLFRDRAVEITRLTLRASRSMITSELRRYADENEVLAFHGELSKLRALYARAVAIGDYADKDPEEHGEKWGWWIADAQERVRKEREAHAREHPILTDPKLGTDEIVVPNAQELGENLRDDAQDRLHDVDKTIDALNDDEGNVWQFDRMLGLAMTELAATKGSIGELIVTSYLHGVVVQKIIKAIGTAVLAIGVGLLTFGTGTVAVLAAGGLLALGTYQAAEEVKAYGQADAAAHSAFDKDQTVSSDSPSAFWAAFSLIAVGLDGAALTSALSAAGASLAELEQTGSLFKFEAALKAAALPEDVKAALLQAFKVRPKLDNATRTLRQALGGGRRAGAKAIKAASRAGYVGAQMGMKEFDQFVAYAKTGMLHGPDLGELAAEDLAALKTAWGQGVERAEKAGVALKRIRGAPEPDPAVTTEPGTTEPGTTDPVATEPGTTQPGTTEPTSTPEQAPEPDIPDVENPPLRVGNLPFSSAAEIHAAVETALGGLARSRPGEWSKVTAALARGGGANREIAELLPVVMDGLCNPKLYAEVMAEAWERAARTGTDVETALREMAMESGLPTSVIPKTSGFLKPPDFFKRYASAEAYFIDLPLATDDHGALTHLIQDLVVDRALARSGSTLHSPQFRGLLARAEGVVARDGQFATNEAMTFLDPPLVDAPELEMPVGDYVWRFTYDLILKGHMPQPENIWPPLRDLLFPKP